MAEIMTAKEAAEAKQRKHMLACREVFVREGTVQSTLQLLVLVLTLKTNRT
jgi:hypothetical protein